MKLTVTVFAGIGPEQPRAVFSGGDPLRCERAAVSLAAQCLHVAIVDSENWKTRFKDGTCMLELSTLFGAFENNTREDERGRAVRALTESLGMLGIDSPFAGFQEARAAKNLEWMEKLLRENEALAEEEK